MTDHIVGQFSDLVFNFDDVESSEREDRKLRKTLTPQAISPDDIYHSITRQYRHVILLAYIFVVGDALTPIVITGAAIRDSTWRTELRQDQDALFRHRSPSYIDENSFYEHISQVLLLYVAKLRENLDFAYKTDILLMDSAPAHKSEQVLSTLGENKMLTVMFPFHTMNILQALGLVFVDAMKKLKATPPAEFGENSMDEQILKPLHASERTATSMTIWSSFRKADFYLNVGFRPFRMHFDEDKLRNNAEFKKF
jgi:hypothetical protein